MILGTLTWKLNVTKSKQVLISSLSNMLFLNVDRYVSLLTFKHVLYYGYLHIVRYCIHPCHCYYLYILSRLQSVGSLKFPHILIYFEDIQLYNTFMFYIHTWYHIVVFPVVYHSFFFFPKTFPGILDLCPAVVVELPPLSYWGHGLGGGGVVGLGHPENL